jgi:hypothetical protein
VTRLQVYWSWFLIPARAGYFSVLQNVETAPGAHQAFYAVGTGVVSAVGNDLGVKLTTYPSLKECKCLEGFKRRWRDNIKLYVKVKRLKLRTEFAWLSTRTSGKLT